MDMDMSKDVEYIAEEIKDRLMELTIRVTVIDTFPYWDSPDGECRIESMTFEELIEDSWHLESYIDNLINEAAEELVEEDFDESELQEKAEEIAEFIRNHYMDIVCEELNDYANEYRYADEDY